MNKLRIHSRNTVPGRNTRPLIVSVISGKGGVGKTVIACNLAEQLADSGCRVLLVDADQYCGNAHILINTATTFGFRDVLQGKCVLRQAVVSISENLDLLGSEGNPITGATNESDTAGALLQRLSADAGEYAVVVLDHPSGRSGLSTALAAASDLSLLVVVPELTSLADGYGLFKHLIRARAKKQCELVVNRTESEDDVEFV
ncbi:MAG: AAA family ATPase, partial [Candidatus Zixiibacteriota bacterium]